MPPRRNKEKLQQITEFKRGRIIDLREGGFSYRAIGARVQRNSSTVMRVWKHWTNEPRTVRKTGSERRKVTSARDDRHLLRLAVNDRTASSRQLTAHHDVRIRVRRYAGERCLPEGVIERHSGLTPRVMSSKTWYVRGECHFVRPLPSKVQSNLPLSLCFGDQRPTPFSSISLHPASGEKGSLLGQGVAEEVQGGQRNNSRDAARREEFELKRKMNRHQEAMKVAIAKKLLSQEENIEEELDINTEDETVSDASEDALESARGDDNDYYYASTDDIAEAANEQNTKSVV
ncbi:transposable element Tc1 transposase [Trichonephila clavipes]|nr:transposable element Tc1 transposase [Trichonephila clavipes]